MFTNRSTMKYWNGSIYFTVAQASIKRLSPMIRVDNLEGNFIDPIFTSTMFKLTEQFRADAQPPHFRFNCDPIDIPFVRFRLM